MPAPYPREFVQLALELADVMNVKAAADLLGIYPRGIYDWRRGPRACELREDGIVSKLDSVRGMDLRAAAELLDVKPKTLREWEKRHAPGAIPSNWRRYDEKTKLAALEVAKLRGDRVAAHMFDISVWTVMHWRQVSVQDPLKPVQKQYTEAEIRMILARAEQIGVRAASNELNVSEQSLHRWQKNKAESNGESLSKRNTYSIEFKKNALRRLHELGGDFAKTARELNCNSHSLRSWKKKELKIEAERSKQKFSQEKIDAALKSVSLIGVVNTYKNFDIPREVLELWVKDAGIVPPKFFGRQGAQDPDFLWIEREDEALAEWRNLAAEWIDIQERAVSSKISALYSYLKSYLIDVVLKSGLSIRPSQVLSRSVDLPVFCSPGASSSSITVNNYVCDFLEWILSEKFSTDDPYGRPLRLAEYHNPVRRLRRGAKDRPDESVYSPLPYGYIDEMKAMINMGPNFCDWTWAQSAMGVPEGTKGGAIAQDWFDVAEERIDKNDPDCVWRVRTRTRVGGGTVLEMWSPVRWVLLLIKLMLPLRGTQARMLDSGEADTFVYRGGGDDAAQQWVVNENPLRSGTERKPRRQGVIRRPPSPSWKNSLDAAVNVFYINTNKTADATKTGAAKGYEMPWVSLGPASEGPAYWFEKLRKWQEKYNPISRTTSWSELDARHIAAKSKVQLAGYPDTCFLFRLPEAAIGETHLPPRTAIMAVPWFAVLREFEQRLSRRGERHADGSKIQLVVASRSAESVRTFFSLHSLRVSLITALVQVAKLPLEVAMKVVGHSRLLMTLYYTKPSVDHIYGELFTAAKRLDAEKSASIVSFLRTAEHDHLIRRAIYNNEAAFSVAMPVRVEERNPAGWMPMHLGLCLTGGNTDTFVDGIAKASGCFNGGPNIGREGHPVFAPVPGGARNCIRCRWFVTEPHHLPALVAHFNNLAYHLYEVREACAKSEQELNEWRLRTGEGTRPDDVDVNARREAERLSETHISRFSLLAEDLVACLGLIERCERALRPAIGVEPSQDDQTTLIPTTLPEIQTKIQDVSSELAQLAVVCADAESYRDLNPGKAVLRRSQLLDIALARQGMPAMFLSLNEEEQLLAGNAFLRAMAAQNSSPADSANVYRVAGLLEANMILREELGAGLQSVFGGRNEGKPSGLRIVGARS